MKSVEVVHWYVFYTKPRFEKKIHQKLIAKGIESYLPLIKVWRQWSDRKKLIEEPLFKSYIFAHVNEKGRLTVLQTEGIVRCVSFNGKVAIVPDEQIEYVKKIVEHKQDSLKVTDALYKGTKVKVISGPLEGMEGYVEYVDEDKWVVFNIEAVNHSIRVKLARDEVIKILDPEPEEQKSTYKFKHII
ncbi:MAG: UpxY family transcription antiterminator [Ignavibacteria bacterium]